LISSNRYQTFTCFFEISRDPRVEADNCPHAEENTTQKHKVCQSAPLSSAAPRSSQGYFWIFPRKINNKIF